MAKKITLVFPLVIVGLLSACGQQPSTGVQTSRVESTSLLFFNDPITEGPVIDQATALSQSAEQLEQASKVNGALMGAALGCGITVLTGSNVRDCVARAAVTGVGGAAIGNVVGEREVERRVELVAPNEIARTLDTATRQFASIKTDLPDLLARQNAALDSLLMQRMNGTIKQDAYDLAVLKIEQERIELAEALSLSARDARRTSRNLEAAARRGQNGLDWHIGAATRLADDVDSTRSTFSIL